MKKTIPLLIALALCFVLPSQTLADLNDGLVAYWPFNGNANDESGNGYYGIVNGATLTEDRFGKPNSAYNFGGDGDFIRIKHNGALNFDFMTESYSVSFWMLFSSFNTGDIFHGIIGRSGGGLNSYGFHMCCVDSPYIKVNVWDGHTNGVDWQSKETAQIGTWYHVVFVADRGKGYFYINGKLDDSPSYIKAVSTI